MSTNVCRKGERERERERDSLRGWGGTVSHIDKERLSFSGCVLIKSPKWKCLQRGEGGREGGWLIKAVIQCFEISSGNFCGSRASSPPSLPRRLAVG